MFNGIWQQEGWNLLHIRRSSVLRWDMRLRRLSIAKKTTHVQEAYKSYPKEKIINIWACYFNNLRGIMKETGGNQYKPAHNNSRNRLK